jgi:tight adherence protein C
MTIVFLTLTGIIAVLFAVSLKKREDMAGAPDVGPEGFKPFLPLGLLILDAVRYGYTTAYDRRLLAAIAEISGGRRALLLLRLHWSKKIITLLAASLFAALIGALSKPDAGYALFCALLLGGAVWLPDRELFEKVKKRRLAIQLEFPDFINKLTLLVNAGLPVVRAWERIAADARKETPLYLELKLTLQDIKAGKPEHRAYEEFAKRCRIHEVTRFITVILQNIRKGNSELVPILRVFANDCWEMRKNTAKRYGEEASTRMLLPMMLMFVAVLLIVGTPAVLALRNI